MRVEKEIEHAILRKVGALKKHMKKGPWVEHKTTTRGKYEGNRAFDEACADEGIPKPVAEYPFNELSELPVRSAKGRVRKWRFDYLFEDWLALEVQGGNWVGGRHTRPAALIKEYEKLNEAAIAGYSVMFCTPQQIKDRSIFPFLKRALGLSEFDKP